MNGNYYIEVTGRIGNIWFGKEKVLCFYNIFGVLFWDKEMWFFLFCFNKENLVWYNGFKLLGNKEECFYSWIKG